MCQGYHWEYEAAMRMTMPQILMLNHAAWVNGERSKRRAEASQKTKTKLDEDDPIVWRGKRLSQLSTDELGQYYQGI